MISVRVRRPKRRSEDSEKWLSQNRRAGVYPWPSTSSTWRISAGFSDAISGRRLNYRRIPGPRGVGVLDGLSGDEERAREAPPGERHSETAASSDFKQNTCKAEANW